MSSKLSLLLKLCVSILLLYSVFRITDIELLKSTFGQIDLYLFALAFILNVIATVLIKSFAVLKLLSLKGMKSVISLFSINLSLRFYSIVLPRPLVIGMRWIKYSAIMNSQKALVVLSVESFLSLVLIPFLALIFILLDSSGKGIRYFPFILLGGCVLVSMPLMIKHAIRAIHNGFLGTFSSVNRFVYWLSARFKFVEEYEKLNIRREVLIPVLLLLVSSFVLFIVGSYVLAKALNLNVSFFALGWVRALVMLFAMMPISIAGLGLREVGFVALLGLFAISPAEALAYSIATFFLQVLIGCLGGGLELISWLKKYVER